MKHDSDIWYFKLKKQTLEALHVKQWRHYFSLVVPVSPVIVEELNLNVCWKMLRDSAGLLVEAPLQQSAIAQNNLDACFLSALPQYDLLICKWLFIFSS